MKKLMYYTMRARGAHRTLAETRRRLADRKEALVQLPEESIRTLSYVLKDVSTGIQCHFTRPVLGLIAVCVCVCQLERELCTVEGEPEASGDRSDPATDLALEAKILSKMGKLRERLVSWTRRLEEFVLFTRISRGASSHASHSSLCSL